MENNNLNETKTTVIGVIIMLGAIIYGALPYFLPDLWEVSGWYVVGGLFSGFLLLFAKDRLIDLLFEYIRKKILGK